MKIGFIGLGKMGFNMVLRLLNGGHELIVWNRSAGAVEEIVKKGQGADGAASRPEDRLADGPLRQTCRRQP
jgi:6-phosphogluconate dehydrogenase